MDTKDFNYTSFIWGVLGSGGGGVVIDHTSANDYTQSWRKTMDDGA